jgi:hypothetical protein
VHQPAQLIFSYNFFSNNSTSVKILQFSSFAQPQSKCLILLIMTRVPGQDLGDAAVRDPELSRDVAGPDAIVGQLHDPLADDVRKGAAVDEDAAELVDAAVTWNN